MATGRRIRAMARAVRVGAGFVVCAACVVCAGCATPKGSGVDERRAHVRQMRENALADLYRMKPGIDGQVRTAPGFGVFSNVGGQFLFVGAGHGYGVVVDQATGHETFMRMANLDVGLGLGLKDFRAVFVFNDRDTMMRFVNEGWAFGAGAEATAKHANRGGEMGQSASSQPIDVYEITSSGIALSATVAGTKYWVDDELN